MKLEVSWGTASLVLVLAPLGFESDGGGLVSVFGGMFIVRGMEWVLC